MRINSFIETGKFYKGNLHLHTTKSDGALSPEDTVAAYKEKGYDFLSITDHRIWNSDTSYGGDDMLIIPGTEIDGSFVKEFCGKENWACHHLVVIDPGEGFKGVPFEHEQRFESANDPDGKKVYSNLMDIIKGRRAIAIYCHPGWSRVELEDMLPLDGCFSLELYNNGCYFEGNCADALNYWDSLLRRGIKVFGVAVDDNHPVYTIGGGWVCVKAASLSQKDVISSLLSGSFYASTGPEIYDFYVENGVAHLECSPCRKIHFAQYNMPGKSSWNENGSLITKGEYKLRENQFQYVRVECEDEFGKRAWTNPIFLK